jgi:hypothetical protein
MFINTSERISSSEGMLGTLYLDTSLKKKYFLLKGFSSSDEHSVLLTGIKRDDTGGTHNNKLGTGEKKKTCWSKIRIPRNR